MSRTIQPTTEGPFFTGKPLSTGWFPFYSASLERLELGVEVEAALAVENGNIPALNAMQIAQRARGIGR